jgi:hypothetical protein
MVKYIEKQQSRLYMGLAVCYRSVSALNRMDTYRMIKVEKPCSKGKLGVELNSNSYGQGLANFCIRRDLSEGDRAKVEEVVVEPSSSQITTSSPSA